MGKFKLAFGIHNHQPVGNFTAVFEEAHQKAYLAFLKLLSEFESVSISLHQSGILWNWQKEYHPEYFELVGKMIDRGQIELMTGGFYEPILTAIPSRDARGQIEMLSEFLKEHFGVQCPGLWLTERIWEPHLPKLLARSGIKFLPIDDTHFIYAGLEHNQLTGPYVTEDEGHTVTLLPIQKKLRYLIPFGTVEKLIGELRSQAERNPNGMAVYADDGEKFGVWPNTHQHCYEDGWLREFFEAVRDNSDWLEIVPLSTAAAAEPVGRAYLPTASYEEMLHWALPTTAYIEYEAFNKRLAESDMKEIYGRFVRGGHWRGFLSKYEESNLMHKKMLWVSKALADFEKAHSNKDEDIRDVRDRLYASQCNCPYWHGVFGGLYLPHIRQAVYSCMIDAHTRLRKASDQTGFSILRQDYDNDGHDEIICDSDEYTAVFKPNLGGMMIDLALNRHNHDITDTLCRRKEGYHAKLDQAVAPGKEDNHASIHDLVLAKEDGLTELLAEDRYLKRCFIDHFFEDGTTPEAFSGSRFGEIGDFVNRPYHTETDPDNHRITHTRDGHVRAPGGIAPVHLSKEFSFEPGRERITICYLLSSSHPGGVDVNFAVENNFNFQAGHAEDRYVLIDNQRPAAAFLDSLGNHPSANTIALVDQYRSVAVVLSSDQSANIWHSPIFTVSLSEGGFERVYQGTSIVHCYRPHLTNKPLKIAFTLLAGDLSTALADNSVRVATGTQM
ncbi:MAG: hypothetical protein DRP45_07340 [Candidatus Zixiibacteriota bacterium]|nr:MAG: hypothetical protein DRP45_07340 [candidate division Zixibacteria bacterium]